MARHIIHLAVETGIQPGLQPGLRGCQIHSGDANGIEAQFPRPVADGGTQRGAIERELIVSSISHAPDDSRPAYSLHLADEPATEALGAALAKILEPGLIVWLSGDLGAGKTTTTRGLLRALGHTGSVKSPTYTLLEPYVVSRIALYHFDFYRFTHPDEFLDAGLDEYFGGAGVCLVEWADRARPHVPLPDLDIRLSVDGAGRRAELRALTEKGRTCLSRFTPPN